MLPLILAITFSFASEIEIDVKTSGNLMNFKIQSDLVVGSARRVMFRGEKRLKATGVSVPVTSLKTGVSLRDEHLHKKLKASQFPRITLQDSIANPMETKGVGKLQVGGVTRPVKFTIEVRGAKAIVKFPLSLSSYGIEGIRYQGIGVKDQVMIKAEVPIAGK